MKRVALLCAGLALCALRTGPAHAIGPQLPGTAPDLYSNPYYACDASTTYYVSNSGQDSNAGTAAAPWATLQHANEALAQGKGGQCIMVTPGTYNGVYLTKSGSLASATGYIAYRCTVLSKCIIKANAYLPGTNNTYVGFGAVGTGSANYTIIDGFNVDGGNETYNVGIIDTGVDGASTTTFASHHFWAINNIVHNNGQGGIAFASADYTYALHNKVYGNASAPSCDNGAQGSGISDNVALDIGYAYPNYVPTADDKINPSPYIGSFSKSGGSFFHKSYSWNLSFNNHITYCGSGANPDTDGNGIILDTFQQTSSGGNAQTYPDETLISFNITFNNGGAGIHVFLSENATIENNTSYNNGIDPYLAGDSAIDTNFSFGNTIIGNIAVSITGATSACTGGSGNNFQPVPPWSAWSYAILGGGYQGIGYTGPDTFTKNISELRGTGISCWYSAYNVGPPNGEDLMFNNDPAYSCTANQCNTDPSWVSVGATSTGTESTPPNGVNFALQSTSPAIGYGLKEPYLLPQSVDAGACFHHFTTCP